LLIAILLLTVFSTRAQAQTTLSSQSSYKDMVGENPDADADIKPVGDFLIYLVCGDLDKAKSLLAENFKGYGPSATDSTYH